MASIPCTASATIIQLNFASKPNNSSSSSSSSLVGSCVSTPYHSELNSQFMGVRKRLGWFRPSRIGPSSAGSRATCWFKFGKNGVDAEKAGIYGSQSRNDFDRDDVEQIVMMEMKTGFVAALVQPTICGRTFHLVEIPRKTYQVDKNEFERKFFLCI